ncbi:30S ribosomal protein S8 [Nitratireductor aquibiodomus RA22]|uniref:30S ribosomal protein S8 n=1 Tax=Nitratireductor aquibiodomus RA22 TaxID=1189611 RepID=I5BUP3_9HYPH|nr:30S ribosomal protein S8 [Nitratireductor aquibiodomus RA22]
MSVNDPLGDMLTRIRNAIGRNKPKVSTPLRVCAPVCSMF